MSSLDAARDLLPSVLPWLNAVLFPAAAAAVTVIVLRLAMHLARPRLPSSAHWTGRAAERHSGNLLLFRAMLASLFGTMLLSRDFTGPLGFLDLHAMLVALAGSVIGVAIVVAGSHTRRYFPELDGRARRRGLATYTLIFLPAWIPAVLTFALLPATPGPAFFAVLGGGLLLLAAAVVGGAFQVARWLRLIRLAPEEVVSIVGRAAAGFDRPPPRVFVADLASVNAVAFPIGNAVCFSGRMLRVMDDAELERIAAHELSHLNERRVDTAKRLLPLLLPLLTMVVRPAIASGYGLEFMLAVLGAFWITLRVRRTTLRLERSADDDARGVVYAAALEKIYRENLLPVVARRRPGTHPELYDRMTAAGVTPDYPRPDPPRARPAHTVAVVATVVALCVAIGGLRSGLVDRAPDDERAALAAVAVTGGDEHLIADLGFHRLDRGEAEEAIVFFEAAVELEPFHPVPRIYLADALIDAGKAGEAATALDLARDLMVDSANIEPWVLEYLTELAEEVDAGSPE